MEDFSDQYNTRLSPKDETLFYMWARSQSRSSGANALQDLADYDLRGWWKKHPGEKLSDAHLEDEFKKPNHPTFSDERKYHGADGNYGGTWSGSEEKGWTFKPGPTNLQTMGLPGLQEYFQQYEPNAQLIGPGQ